MFKPNQPPNKQKSHPKQPTSPTKQTNKKQKSNQPIKKTLKNQTITNTRKVNITRKEIERQ